MSDPRTRTAYHEAGHATMAYFMHRPINVVSIRRTEHYRGITGHRVGRFPEEQIQMLHRPVPLQPAKMRRVIETEICITLAGDIAGNLTGFLTGYVPDSEDELQAERSLRAIEELSVRERESLDRFESGTTPLEDDEDSARLNSLALDSDAPGAHLAWLREVTKALVYSPRFRRAVEALANELLRREVVGGRRARQVIEEAVHAHRPRRVEAVAASRPPSSPGLALL